jgi:cytochrome c556
MPRFSCPNCEKALKSSAPPGKKIKCPGCSHVFPVPDEETTVIQADELEESSSPPAAPERHDPKRRATTEIKAAERPSKKTRPQVDDDSDDDTDDQVRSPRPKPKKKAKSQSNLVLILGGVAALLVLVAVAAFVWPGFLAESSGKTKSGGSPNLVAQGQGPGTGREGPGRRRGPGPKDGAGDKEGTDPKEGVEAKSDAETKNDAGVKEAAPGDAPSATLSIREIMARMNRGPQSLGKIGKELRAEPPPWDTLQTETSEYTSLAKSMAAHDPPRGSKESWATQTSAFAESASALEQSVQRKDRDGALAAHKSLENSCMACHQQHRGGPGGKGGFGKGGFGGKGFKKGPPPPQN